MLCFQRVTAISQDYILDTTRILLLFLRARFLLDIGNVLLDELVAFAGE